MKLTALNPKAQLFGPQPLAERGTQPVHPHLAIGHSSAEQRWRGSPMSWCYYFLNFRFSISLSGNPSREAEQGMNIPRTRSTLLDPVHPRLLGSTRITERESQHCLYLTAVSRRVVCKQDSGEIAMCWVPNIKWVSSEGSVISLEGSRAWKGWSSTSK